MLTDDTAERGRAIKAQLARIEDEYGPIPAPMVRHEHAENCTPDACAPGCPCAAGKCRCVDIARGRRFTDWVDTLMGYEPEDVAAGVSALLRTWKRYGRDWPDREELVSLIPKRPDDPEARMLWERVQRAALYGETDLLDPRTLAAIGGVRYLPVIADRLEHGRRDPAAHAHAYRVFQRRLAMAEALPAHEAQRELPPPASPERAALARQIQALADAADKTPDQRPRLSRARRALAEVPEFVERPVDTRALDAQRKALAAWRPGEVA